MAVSAHASYWPRTTAYIYVPSTGEKDVHAQLTGIRGLIRAENPRRTQYAVRSPTGHWNFVPYGARKLPGSSM